MKTLCLLFLSTLSVQSFAALPDDCQELRSEQIRLSLTASNLANLNSTCTPEGGAYQPYTINSCSNGGCDVSQAKKAPLLKYVPNHPDADKNGYVAYPNIDEQAEYATFHMTATKLKLMASRGACHSKLVVDPESQSFTLRYLGKSVPDVKEDVFHVNAAHNIDSWMRQDAEGRSTVVQFASSGQIVDHAQSDYR